MSAVHKDTQSLQMQQELMRVSKSVVTEFNCLLNVSSHRPLTKSSYVTLVFIFPPLSSNLGRGLSLD